MEDIEIKTFATGVTKVNEAFEKLISQVNKTGNALEKMEKTGNNFGKNFAKNIKNASNEIESMGNKADSTVKKMEKFNTISDTFRNVQSTIKKATQVFSSLVGNSIDYSEELNLFNVVFNNNMDDMGTQFSEVGLKAEKFQQQLHEAFGTNMLDTRRYQALFQSMGENMGIATDKAELMSTNLTKLSYDIASLYNAEETDVAQAIRAGVYAGQTKPLRRFGIDVTQVSMQPVMDELGLDKSISELSQAEKQIIRYISVIKQASVTHGDFANTIESPANQLKILKQQVTETSIALGNLFVNAFAKMLPYANAILMVIKEVAKAIASFFGIKVQDFNSGISTTIGDYDDLSDSLDSVGDSASGASNAVKELKRQTLGFDQINNITSPTPSSGSSGGGVSGGSSIGGIDQKLLDALAGYENGMEKVRMKANEIRDKIMDWLGFTKEIDPLTGEVSWKFEGIGKTLKSIWEHFLGLSTTGKVLMSLGILAGATTLWKIGEKLVTIFGKTGLGKAITGLISPTTSLISLIVKSKGSLSTSITEWKKHQGILNKNGEAVGGLAGKMANLKTILGGLTISILGMAVYHDSFKSIREEGFSLTNVLGTVGGAIATVGGAMTTGATIAGPYGAVIGGCVGALLLMFDTMDELSDHYPEHTRNLEEIKKKNEELQDSYNNNIDAIERGIDTQDAQIESDKKLLEELQSITDENGHVKEGYEDRANFILGRMKEAYGVEYSMVDGTIQNYKGIISTINDVISAKKAEVYFNAYQKEYEEAVIASATAEETLKDSISKRNGALKELEEKQDRANYLTEWNTAITKQLSEEKDTLSDKYKKLSKQLQDNYKELETNGNRQNELKEIVKNYGKEIETTTDTYINAKNKENTYSDMWVAQQSGNWAEVERIYKEGSKKTTKDFKNSLVEQANAVQSGSELPESVIEGFRVLATNSETEYQKALSLLSGDTRTEIENALKETDKKKKSAYGTYFNFGTETKSGYNTATKGLADESTKYFLNKLTSKSTQEKYKNAGKTSGKSTMSGIKSETDKGVSVKVTANTNTAKSQIQGLSGTSINCPVKLYTDGKYTVNLTKSKALGGIFSNGIWKNIKQYASGGIPTHGTVFTAGEAGPEIVGHVNGRTEVLNQSQLASVMYEAVTRAISNSNLANGVEVYAHTDEGVIIDRINRRTRQTGQCPIEI